MRRGSRRFALVLTVAALALANGVAAAQESVRVRGGAHPTFGRLVFDWPAPVGASAKIEGNRLIVNFERPMAGDLSKIGGALGDYVKRGSLSADGRTATFELAKPLVIKSQSAGKAVIVDLAAGKDAAKPDAAKPEPAKAEAPKPNGDKAAKPVTAKAEDAKAVAATAATAAAAAAAPATARVIAPPPPSPFKTVVELPPVPAPATASAPSNGEAKANSATTGLTVDETIPPPNKAGAAFVVKPGEKPPAKIVKEELSETEQQFQSFIASLQTEVRMELQRTPDGFRFSTTWPRPSAAAVFERGGYLWVVHDQLARVAFPPQLGAEFADVLTSIEQMPFRRGTVLRMNIKGSLQANIDRRETVWTVTMGASGSAPNRSIPIRPDPTAEEGARIFLQVTDATNRIEYTDPEVGDVMHILPVAQTSTGVAQSRDFVEFDLHRTFQGILVLPRVDGIRVRPTRNGVEVATGSDGGLALFGSVDPEAEKKKREAEERAKAALIEEDEYPKIEGETYKYRTWRSAERGTFNEALKFLKDELSTAPPTERAAKRRALAEFYFAHNMGPEAISVMVLAEEQDLRIGRDVSYRALRGAANLLKNRREEAAHDLLAPELASDLEVGIWRGLLHTRRGEWDKAVEEFTKSFNQMRSLPRDVRAKMRLAAARAAIEAKKTSLAEQMLQLLERETPSASAEAQMNLLRGRLFAAKGAAKEALDKFKEGAESEFPDIRAEAEYARINHEFQAGTLKRKDAVKALEKLQLSWRGGDFELGVLKRIAELHLRDKDYRGALSIMRYGVKYFANTSGGKDMAKDMNDTFQKLFIEGLADQMEPVAALGLYYEFRELTPPGRRGDQLLDRLADRLVRVDLLEEAAKVVQQQVTFRLRAEQRAESAAKLAIIYLLDKKPEEALKTLRESDWPSLSPKIKEDRRHLEGRALSDLTRYDEALKLLEGDGSRKADELRADIYWTMRNWLKTAEALERLLAPKVGNFERLTPIERNQVMRLTVAYTLADDITAVKRTRQRFGDRMGGPPEGEAFVALTVDVDRKSTDFRSLAGAVANLVSLEAFLTSYKDKLIKGGLSAYN
jgi:hypothetical protein